MQEIRRFKPSTVSRRFSVTAGFYRTCVIDSIMEPSSAEHVRSPAAPAESPTLGFTHLQFEALLTAARESADPCDFALVACSGCSVCGSSKLPARTRRGAGQGSDPRHCRGGADGEDHATGLAGFPALPVDAQMIRQQPVCGGLRLQPRSSTTSLRRSPITATTNQRVPLSPAIGLHPHSLPARWTESR